MGLVAKSDMKNSFLIYEDMRKYLKEALVIYSYDFATDPF